MALNRVPYPANLTDQADFSAHGTLIETGCLDKSFAPLLVLGGEIPQGIVLQIGGVVYRADSAETVTGSSSKYIRIVPAGATATANYVANLSGVSWNAQYNGYYDGSGNLYIFDENRALYDGAVATVKTRFVQQTEEGDVFVGRDLVVKGDVVIDGTIDTGQGTNELYPMDQGVRTTDDVQFNNIDIQGNLRKGSNNPDLIGGGRVAGFYTGTSNTEINYPIGTVILTNTVSSNINLNASVNVRYEALSQTFEIGGGATVLVGTWRSRGRIVVTSSTYRYLFQRVS